jgi:thioredoxin reductase
LVIDAGKPCNRQTPHSHNFITRDGETPAALRKKALEQVSAYSTVHFTDDEVITAHGMNNAFGVKTAAGKHYTAKRILLATGVKDIPLPIPGFAECWGISVLHCPYCHGYEVRDEALGIIANGDMGFEYAKLINHWSEDLTVFTNGTATFNAEQLKKLQGHNINIIEHEIASMHHTNGYLDKLVFKNGETHALKAVFARGAIQMHNNIAEQLGCGLHTEGMLNGLLVADDFGKTSSPGVFAAGDNIIAMRSVAAAVAAGNKTGAVINKELIDEMF